MNESASFLGPTFSPSTHCLQSGSRFVFLRKNLLAWWGTLFCDFYLFLRLWFLILTRFCPTFIHHRHTHTHTISLYLWPKCYIWQGLPELGSELYMLRSQIYIAFQDPEGPWTVTQAQASSMKPWDPHLTSAKIQGHKQLQWAILFWN